MAPLAQKVARPHPGLLPRGEGDTSSVPWEMSRLDLTVRPTVRRTKLVRYIGGRYDTLISP